jgi:GGDEF domain-containing protein
MSNLISYLRFINRCYGITSTDDSNSLGLGNSLQVRSGGLIDILPAPAFRRFYTKANEWFRIGSEDCQQLLRDITTAANELVKTLGLSCPTQIDADQVIQQAERQLAELAASDPAATVVSRNTEALLAQHGWTDPATGAVGRPALDDAVNEAFRLLALEDEPFSVVHMMLPKLGSAAGAEDAVALTVMTVLRKHYDPAGGVICRMKPELFSIVTPGLDRLSATAVTRECLADLQNRTRREGAAVAAQAMIAVAGVAGADVATRSSYKDGQQVAIAALDAMRIAGKSGAFAMEVHQPKSVAA